MRHGYAAPTIAVLALAASLAGCSAVLGTAPGESRSPQPRMLVQVRTSDGVVGAYRTGSVLWLYAGPAEGSMTPITSTSDSGAGPTVHLITYGGETGQAINSFVYGSMPVGATTVVVGPGRVGGTVSKGTYVVGLPIKDLLPGDLTWTFLDAAGTVVRQGSNITP